MGLTSPNLKYILKAAKKNKIKGPVLTLGNQDIYATQKEVEQWIQDEKLPLIIPKKIIYSTSKGLSEINKESDKYIHARTFFEYMNIPESQYYDIDLYSFDKPKILHDLEKPISTKYHNFFNFIIDGGTLEHILDVKSVLSNLVKMTKVGGHILQLNPAQNFLNHGFYQFSPTLFYDFYTANGFEVVEAYMVEVRSGAHRFYTYNHMKDYLGMYFKPGSRIINCFLLRKKANVKQILSPSQYIYQQLAKNPKQVQKDWEGGHLNQLVLHLRKIVPIRYHGLFFGSWQYLKRVTERRKYFDIKI